MTAIAHRSSYENAMHSNGIGSNMQELPNEETAPTPGGNSSRLETIHELIRSGDYHVPATAIADRMIERIIVDKRGSTP